MTATIHDLVHVVPVAALRSSAVPKDDRHDTVAKLRSDRELRSSAVPKDDRHVEHLVEDLAPVRVAILGRPEGQPPPGGGVRRGVEGPVAILGRPEGRPPHAWPTGLAPCSMRLRSSAVPKDDRHQQVGEHLQVGAGLRSSAVPKDDRHPSVRRNR
ncbi:hypothetical protein [Kitasatospora griseola]|uniref:hypothetical protein n=1 Tax=Kitasatospora griseola TaxID=2064 RepID=UPI00402B5746